MGIRTHFVQRKRRDTGNPLIIQMIDRDGEIIDVSTGVNEVRFYMTSRKNILKMDDDASDPFTEIDFTKEGNVTGVMTNVTDGSDGKVQYDWATDDLEVAGWYYGEIEIKFTSGNRRSYPEDEYIEIVVRKDIGQE